MWSDNSEDFPPGACGYISNTSTVPFHQPLPTLEGSERLQRWRALVRRKNQRSRRERLQMRFREIHSRTNFCVSEESNISNEQPGSPAIEIPNNLNDALDIVDLNASNTSNDPKLDETQIPGEPRLNDETKLKLNEDMELDEKVDFDSTTNENCQTREAGEQNMPSSSQAAVIDSELGPIINDDPSIDQTTISDEPIVQTIPALEERIDHDLERNTVNPIQSNETEAIDSDNNIAHSANDYSFEHVATPPDVEWDSHPSSDQEVSDSEIEEQHGMFQPVSKMYRPLDSTTIEISKDSLSDLKRDFHQCEKLICAALNSNCSLTLELFAKSLDGLAESKVKFCHELELHLESFNLKEKLKPASFVSRVKVKFDTNRGQGLLDLLKQLETKSDDRPVATLTVEPDIESSVTLFRFMGKSCFLNEEKNGVVDTSESVRTIADDLATAANYQFIDVLSGSKWARTKASLGF